MSLILRKITKINRVTIGKNIEGSMMLLSRLPCSEYWLSKVVKGFIFIWLGRALVEDILFHLLNIGYNSLWADGGLLRSAERWRSLVPWALALSCKVALEAQLVNMAHEITVRAILAQTTCSLVGIETSSELQWLIVIEHLNWEASVFIRLRLAQASLIVAELKVEIWYVWNINEGVVLRLQPGKHVSNLYIMSWVQHISEGVSIGIVC